MTNRPFPVDAIATAVAIAYRNPDISIIHKSVLPPIPVLAENFSWLEYPIGEAFTVPELQVGRLGRVGEVSFSAVSHDGKTRDYGLDDVVPLSDIREAEKARQSKVSSYDPVASAIEGLANLVNLGREIRAANVVQNPANFDTDRKLALAGTDKFSDFENSDPFAVLNEGMRKPLVFRANTIVMGEVVWEVIKRHPRLIKAVKGGLTDEGAISRVQFAELMEIKPERLLIGSSIVNMSRPGQDIDLQQVWGNSIQMLYVSSTKASATDGVLTWGFTAENGTRIAGSIDEPLVGLEGGRRVRIGEKVHEVVCAKSLGYQIQDVI